MKLSDLDIKEEYFTGETDLVDFFYKPCLSVSTNYDRSVGYFRSSVFLLIGPNIIDFVKHGGKIRLICSPYLTEDDVSAISQGYKQKAEVVEDTLQRDINKMFENQAIAKNTEALATLIALGSIEVKIVFLPKAQGEYHAKLGVFYDEYNNAVSFKGSVN